MLLPRLRQPPQGADRRPSAPLPVPRAPTLICRASPAKKTHGKHPFRCTAHAFAGDTSLPEKPGLVGPSAHPPHRSQNGKSSKDQRTTVGVRWAHGRASSQSRQHAHVDALPTGYLWKMHLHTFLKRVPGPDSLGHKRRQSHRRIPAGGQTDFSPRAGFGAELTRRKGCEIWRRQTSSARRKETPTQAFSCLLLWAQKSLKKFSAKIKRNLKPWGG